MPSCAKISDCSLLSVNVLLIKSYKICNKFLLAVLMDFILFFLQSDEMIINKRNPYLHFLITIGGSLF